MSSLPPPAPDEIPDASMLAPSPPSPPSPPDPTRAAGFGSRLGALLIDAVVAAAIALPFTIGAIVLLRIALADCYTLRTTTRDAGTTTLHCDDGALKVPFLIGAIALFAIGALLAFGLQVRWLGKGQTPGLRAVGNRLVGATDGQPIGAGRALLRSLIRVVSAIPCLLGFAWMLWDKRGQTWHDKAAHSVVIKG